MSERFTPRNHENVVSLSEYRAEFAKETPSLETPAGRELAAQAFLDKYQKQIDTLPDYLQAPVYKSAAMYIEGVALGDLPPQAEGRISEEGLKELREEILNAEVQIGLSLDEMLQARADNHPVQIRYYRNEHGLSHLEAVPDLEEFEPDEQDEEHVAMQALRRHLRLVSNENEPPSDDTPPPVA